MKKIFLCGCLLCWGVLVSAGEIIFSNCEGKKEGEWCAQTVRFVDSLGNVRVVHNDLRAPYQPKTLEEKQKLKEFALLTHYRPDNPEVWLDKAKYCYQLYLKEKSPYLLNQALSAFEQVTRIQPERDEAYFYQGIIQSKLGSLSSALTAFENTLKYNPNYDEAYLEKGWLLLLLDQPALAAPEFEASVRLHPENPRGYVGLAKIQVMQGNLQQALQIYNAAPKNGGRTLAQETYKDEEAFVADLSAYENALQKGKADYLNKLRAKARKSFKKKPYYSSYAKSCFYVNPFDEECKNLYLQTAVKEARFDFKREQEDVEHAKLVARYAQKGSSFFPQQKVISGHADRTLEELIRLFPDYAPGYYEYAKLKASRGDYSKSLQALRQYLEKEKEPVFSKKEAKFWKKTLKKHLDNEDAAQIKTLLEKFKIQ